MFEDILEDKEKEDEKEEELVKVEEMSVKDTAVVLYKLGEITDPGQVVHINMRLLRILEIHDAHIVTILGPIPKWAIRQYVKDKSRRLYENIEFDGTKILILDRYGIVRGWLRLTTSII